MSQEFDERRDAELVTEDHQRGDGGAPAVFVTLSEPEPDGLDLSVHGARAAHRLHEPQGDAAGLVVAIEDALDDVGDELIRAIPRDNQRGVVACVIGVASHQRQQEWSVDRGLKSGEPEDAPVLLQRA